MHFRLRLASVPPVTWRPHLVRAVPTVDAVRALCERERFFSPGTRRTIPGRVAYFLEGRRAKGHLYPQFTAGADPLVLLKEVRAYEAEHSPASNGAHAWGVRAIAVWVAHELARIDGAFAFADLFALTPTADSADADLEDTPPAAAAPAETAPLGIASPTPPAEATLTPPPAVAAPAALPPAQPHPPLALADVPPSVEVQFYRTCATIPQLREYLRTGADRRRRVDLTNAHGPKVLAHVQGWLASAEGVAWVRDKCALTPGAVSVDHVVPRSIGGLHHLHNLHLMPNGVNSQLGDNWDARKRAYVGPRQVELAQRLHQYHRDHEGTLDGFFH